MFRLQPPRPTLSNGQPAGSKYPGKQVEQNFGQNHHNFAVGAFMIKIKIHLSATGNKNAQISITSPLGDLFHSLKPVLFFESPYSLTNLFYCFLIVQSGQRLAATLELNGQIFCKRFLHLKHYTALSDFITFPINHFC